MFIAIEYPALTSFPRPFMNGWTTKLERYKDDCCKIQGRAILYTGFNEALLNEILYFPPNSLIVRHILISPITKPTSEESTDAKASPNTPRLNTRTKTKLKIILIKQDTMVVIIGYLELPKLWSMQSIW